MEIRILDEATIDKIAAGEVVDRPCSVVKELVENAMDSGANAITVEIRDGGIAMIRVTDNGEGIEKDQIEKAFMRHATSKIKDADDLLKIISLGFRGEALSSICAVSQVEMITRTENALTGIRYCIDGGKEISKDEIGAPKGTTVIMRNLFFNVPPRRKFLKTPQTEASQISDLMEHLAISRPDISFKYMVNGQVRFYTTGNGNLQEIIYRIYGRDIATNLIPIDCSQNGVHITGLIGTPMLARSNRNFEIYFINCRYIRSKIIATSVEEAYKPYLMQHKFPFFVLHFTMDPNRLDVNVHPSKMEVRLMDRMEISQFLRKQIEAVLTGKEMLREVKFESESELKKENEADRRLTIRDSVPEPFEVSARNSSPKEQMLQMQLRKKENTHKDSIVHAEFTMPEPEISTVAEEAVFSVDFTDEAEKINRINEPKMKENLQNVGFTRIFGQTDQVNAPENDKKNAKPMENVIKRSEHILVEKPVQMNLFEDRILTKDLRSEYHVIGQIFDTYWIFAFRDKMIFMDQHAAHEKVKYEKFCKQILNGEVLSQNLNPPIILTFSAKEEEIFLRYQAYFKDLGFEIEAFGGKEYALRSVPMECYGSSEKELFQAIMDELAETNLVGTPEIIRNKIASMSCKAAVKGNHAMTLEEISALMDELMELENPYHCPHGRPTIVTLSKYELEKRFSRIVT